VKNWKGTNAIILELKNEIRKVDRFKSELEIAEEKKKNQ
jgi:hypothetical protein